MKNVLMWQTPIREKESGVGQHPSRILHELGWTARYSSIRLRAIARPMLIGLVGQSFATDDEGSGPTAATARRNQWSYA